MGSQPPLGIHLLWCGVLHGLQVEICSTVNLHGLQGDSLPHHGLHHGLQGNFCSGAWSTSSPPSSLCLQSCFSHIFSFLPLAVVTQLPPPLLKYVILEVLPPSLMCSALANESQNRIGRKRPLRSSNPTVNLTLPRPPLYHVPKHLSQTSFKYLQGWRLNHFPGQPVPMLDNPFSEEKFPNIQSKPPLAQLEAISSCPIPCYLGEETDPHLSTTSFQAVVESDEVSPQPPFLQAKQPQVPQPLPLPLNKYIQGWKRPLRSSSPTSNLALPSPPLNHVPKHHIYTSFKYLQGWSLNDFPGQPVPRLDNPFGEKIFPNIQSKPPLVQLKAISSFPMACYLQEETNTHLSTTSFQVVVESDKVSPQPPFLQAKQSQFPQLLLISLVLQTLHQLRCPSLDTLQHLNVSLGVRGPTLNTAFEVWPHQCRVQGADHFPSPAGHTISDTSQDAVGLLGHLSTLPHNLVSSANLLRVHSIPSSRSLIKILNRTGPNSEPWGTALVTGRQLDLTPFTTTLWAWPSSQFFTQQRILSAIPPGGGRPVPRFDNPFGEEIFPNTQSKHPLVQLEAISSCHMACYLQEETNTHLSTTSFQVVVESDKVSPQPPFLQTKQPQFPQPLLISLVLQTLHQLRCPSLDTLQHLNVSLVVRGPKLNTVFEVRPHQCQVQGHDHCPSPAGHAISDTSQDAVGLLGHLGTLLAHIQPSVNQYPQVLFCQAAFQPLFPKPVALHGVVVTQVQDPALSLVEPLTTGLSPSTQPSLPTLKQIKTPAQLGVICKLTEGALDPLVQIIDKDIKQNWPQHRALGNSTCD
ncbi:hypothetical protein QYF61_004168 [Mycteria americana]|uniref:Uncharacterized protein n=1 Tax=Mycteria americana TaxID=33587 RepID=A0AAN7SFF9_MYCAM|nr:hypothetical protein QYF61_004168 [Mycteria americana]